jgi:hypothetical protein
MIIESNDCWPLLLPSDMDDNNDDDDGVVEADVDDMALIILSRNVSSNIDDDGNGHGDNNDACFVISMSVGGSALSFPLVVVELVGSNGATSTK